MDDSPQRRLAVDAKPQLQPVAGVDLIHERRAVQQQLREQASRHQRLVLVGGNSALLQVVKCPDDSSSVSVNSPRVRYRLRPGKGRSCRSKPGGGASA